MEETEKVVAIVAFVTDPLPEEVFGLTVEKIYYGDLQPSPMFLEKMLVPSAHYEDRGGERLKALYWALESFPNAEFYEYDPVGNVVALGRPSITVKTQKIGFHHWKDAPREVAYLRQSHRHVFLVAFTIHDLNHNDRDQEFHLVQKWVTERFDHVLDVAAEDGMSCEMMAQALCIEGRVKYRSRITCTVSEDGENHATVTV